MNAGNMKVSQGKVASGNQKTLHADIESNI